VLRYYQTRFHDLRALTFGDLRYYGGLFDGIAALLAHALHLGHSYGFRHVLNLGTGLLGVAGTWCLGRLAGGPRVGIWSGLLLVAIPAWYGHMFNNPKDIPFATASVWALCVMLDSLPLLPRLPASRQLALGLTLGLALAVRIGALLMFAYLGLVVVLVVMARAARLRTLWLCVGSLLTPVAVAWTIMLLFWPWAQSQPLTRPLLALRVMSRFPHDVWFPHGGTIVRSTDLPWTYTLHVLVVTLPEIVLVGLGAALVVGIRAWRSVRLGDLSCARWILIVAATVVPILFVSLMHTTLYNMWRHLLFIAPPLCVLAAAGLDRLLQWSRARSWLRWGCTAALATYALWHVNTMRALHPDEYVYFNALVGGLAGAEGRYELDYWGNSKKEAVELLADHLRSTEGPHPRSYKVAVCEEPVNATHYFPTFLELSQEPEKADFFLQQPGASCPLWADGPLLVRVVKLGVPLSVIEDLRGVRADTVTPPRLR